jgi:hypothetical protein
MKKTDAASSVRAGSLLFRFHQVLKSWSPVNAESLFMYDADASHGFSLPGTFPGSAGHQAS